MGLPSARNVASRLRTLLRGDSSAIAEWLAERGAAWFATCLLVMIVGCGLYGATVGLWHAPRQAAYTAIKFPLLVLLTTAGNAMLNGMLAQLLGTGLSFRQTSLAILLSFTLASLILAALSPLTLFVLWNAPSQSSGQGGFAVVQLMHITAIAFAGIIANRRLLGLIRQYSPTPAAARRTLFAWLAGNLLLGSQIAWILRPFVGTPGLPIEFLRADAPRGNFFESVFSTLLQVFR